jgi:hypothetical protein
VGIPGCRYRLVKPLLLPIISSSPRTPLTRIYREYPASDVRGGKLADTANFVDLVREMKTAFNGNYGISLTLAPDYWYLRGFDAKAMEPYVDFFGFMAYVSPIRLSNSTLGPLLTMLGFAWILGQRCFDLGLHRPWSGGH